MTQHSSRISGRIRPSSILRKKQSLKTILVVFILVALVLAIISGLTKNFSFKKSQTYSDWNGKFPFIAALSTSPPSLLIYQTDPKRLIILHSDQNTYYPTGQTENPITKFIVSENFNARYLTKIFSHAFGTSVQKYIILKSRQNPDQENFEKLFKNFASPITPVLILTGIIDTKITNTNITRIDMLKLWWQLKDLRINKLNSVDLSSIRQDIISADNQKVQGVDEGALNRNIRQYLEIPQIINEPYQIEINNGTGSFDAGQLALQFVESYNLKVDKFQKSEASAKTIIYAQYKNDLAFHLAKIFECDISTKTSQEKLITIIVGEDFQKKYFE